MVNDNGEQIPYTGGNGHSGLEDQVIATAEAFALLGVIWFLARGIKRHPGTGVIFIISAIAAVWVLIAGGGIGTLAWVFWGCVLLCILCAGKLMTR